MEATSDENENYMTPEKLAELVAGSPYPELSVSQLIRAIVDMFPGSVHGREFLVAWFVDPATNVGGGRAFIIDWKRPEPEPSIADIDQHIAANEHLLDEPPVVIVLPVNVLFGRMTDEEAESLDTAMMAEPLRIRRMWSTASSFRSDQEPWAVIKGHAIGLFGQDRADEILAQA